MIPSQFVQPQLGAINNGVAPTFISQTGGTPFEFKVIKQHSPKKSEELGYEFLEDVEIVLFYIDDKTVCSRRIDKTFWQDHPEILPEYERWKAGKSANMTDLREWTAVSHSEIASLFRAGFICVEQILEASDERLMAIGPDWKEVKRKAEQHLKAKTEKVEAGKYAEELSALKLERERDRAEAAELRAFMEEMKRELEAAKAPSGKPQRLKKDGTPWITTKKISPESEEEVS